ncbi:MAG: metalloregulator ArsR/SmtB family transcription factor [Proteobacteria bacterium]|nr:metalloregulator ArsR/SmtB family transcription factor [Pseudomonadota bacterium]MDA0951637.1 metalloregulator ArsR/SmtB family transcription factor [Pseudomonadota bacterium]
MDQFVATLSAIAESTRLRILALCGRAELTVSELQQVLSQSQPRISRHLRVLCEAGLLNRRREGAWTFYRLRHGCNEAQVARDILARLPEGDPVLKGDLDRLAQVKETRRQAAEQYFRANAAGWDEIRAMHADTGVIERRLLELVPAGPATRLIDIGTGTGRILQIFAPRIAYGLGIDLSHEMLTVARVNLDAPEFANCGVQHGDMYRLPCRDEKFDIAILYMVLHYAEHPGEVIEEAARVLRPGGRLVVVDFAPHENLALREEHAHRWPGFSEQAIDGFFAQAGLLPASSQAIAEGQLTVSIWSAERAASVTALAPAGAIG